MRFTDDEMDQRIAHQWWKPGDYPDEATPYDAGALGMGLHDHCGQAWAGHGQLGDQTLCPSNWVLTDDDGGYTIIADRIDPYSLDPEGLMWVITCRDCGVYEEFPTFNERRTRWADHLQAHPDHACDAYEIAP